MNGPAFGDARADAVAISRDAPRPTLELGPLAPRPFDADLDRLVAQCDAAHRLNQGIIEAFDRHTRAACEDTLRLAAAVAAAMEPIRAAVERCADALQRSFDARRRHPNHVIDDAWTATTKTLPPMSDEERIRAALAAFKYCRPPRLSKLARAKLDEHARVSAVANAMRAFGETCVAHPDLRRAFATAIASELKDLDLDERIRLVDRLDRDACAVAARRRVPVRLESVREGPGASRVLEDDSIADALVAAYVAGVVRDAAEDLRRSNPRNAAAVDYLSGDDAREEVAARHGLTERQVQRAEERVRRKFETLRRRVD